LCVVIVSYNITDSQARQEQRIACYKQTDRHRVRFFKELENITNAHERKK
jgi:hypothetical protein